MYLTHFPSPLPHHIMFTLINQLLHGVAMPPEPHIFQATPTPSERGSHSLGLVPDAEVRQKPPEESHGQEYGGPHPMVGVPHHGDA